VRWKKVTLVGVGLLGGSLGAALKKRQLAERVVGFVRRPSSVGECLKAKAVDSATLDLRKAVEQAELIVFCTPIAQMRSLLEQMAPALTPGTIITDVGSVKETVVNQLEPISNDAGCHFVGSHPMAGAEKTGVSAARADLFEKAVCVITPTGVTNKPALKKVSALWKSVGSRLMSLSPKIHDELVSRSSHLPHIISATLANVVLDGAWPREQALLCATGFRDSTRIASGSPEMWRDIDIANHKNLTRAIDLFIREFKSVRRMIDKRDPRLLEQFLQQAKQRRDKWRGS
jgi:prephenate dehydrogenase